MCIQYAGVYLFELLYVCVCVCVLQCYVVRVWEWVV